MRSAHVPARYLIPRLIGGSGGSCRFRARDLLQLGGGALERSEHLVAVSDVGHSYKGSSINLRLLSRLCDCCSDSYDQDEEVEQENEFWSGHRLESGKDKGLVIIEWWCFLRFNHLRLWRVCEWDCGKLHCSGGFYRLCSDVHPHQTIGGLKVRGQPKTSGPLPRSQSSESTSTDIDVIWGPGRLHVKSLSWTLLGLQQWFDFLQRKGCRPGRFRPWLPLVQDDNRPRYVWANAWLRIEYLVICPCSHPRPYWQKSNEGKGFFLQAELWSMRTCCKTTCS